MPTIDLSPDRAAVPDVPDVPDVPVPTSHPTAPMAPMAPTAPASPGDPERPTDPPPAARLEVVAWTDPSFELTGHDPRSLYVERFWLGLLGPSTVWMLRRFARGLEEHPEGFRVDLVETGRALGLGESTSRNSTTQRTVQRACQFGAAYRVTPVRLAVRTHLPTLTRRQLSRLPETVQRAHERWTADASDPREVRLAGAVAAGLRDAGLSVGEIERRLRSWGYAPVTIRDAVDSAMGWHRPE